MNYTGMFQARQINRRLLIQKLSTEVPPTQEGSPPTSAIGNGSVAAPPIVSSGDAEGVAAAPPIVNANDAEGVAAAPPIVNANDAEAVAAAPPAVNANGAEAVAAAPPIVNANDAEAVAAAPPIVNANDAEAVAVAPPIVNANDAEAVAAAPPIVNGNDAEAVAAPPPNVNSGDAEGGAAPPPIGNSGDAEGGAPPPPNGNPDDADEDLREKILRASLSFVLEHGWTKKTLSSGAESLGLPSVAHGMFPKGGADLINFFSQDCNAQLTKQLAQKVEENKQLEDGTKPSTRTFIQEALQERLQMLVPYIERWPHAMAIQAQPQNSCQALSNVCHLVDDIWHYAGDRSTDLNWYSKRFIVAGIYKSTQIFMVQDKSEDFEDTWIFLDNRFNNVADIAKNVKQCKNTTDAVADNLWGMSLMLQNILGVNSRVR